MAASDSKRGRRLLGDSRKAGPLAMGNGMNDQQESTDAADVAFYGLLGEHIDNVFDPSKDGAESYNRYSRYACGDKLSRESEWANHLAWINAHVVGPPKATEFYSVEELKAMGMIGIYAIPTGIRSLAPLPSAPLPSVGPLETGVSCEVAMQTNEETMRWIIDAAREEKRRIAEEMIEAQRGVSEFATVKECEAYNRALRDFSEKLHEELRS